ncbi:MAG: LPS export ABC transporter permease LptF, partial [Desulfobulbaceae bacterium]|nr:LPS export ABC transporter permease LptF [Desulfobulbaceae bacterium]
MGNNPAASAEQHLPGRRTQGDGPRWLPRPPLLLWSYVATEMLAPFFASFIILYCVFFLIRLIPL